MKAVFKVCYTGSGTFEGLHILPYCKRISISGEAQGFQLFLTQYKEIKTALFMRMDGLASNYYHQNSFQNHLSLMKCTVNFLAFRQMYTNGYGNFKWTLTQTPNPMFAGTPIFQITLFIMWWMLLPQCRQLFANSVWVHLISLWLLLTNHTTSTTFTNTSTKLEVNKSEHPIIGSFPARWSRALSPINHGL